MQPSRQIQAIPTRGLIAWVELGSETSNGSEFRSDDVLRMMRELWAEYVASNLQPIKK